MQGAASAPHELSEAIIELSFHVTARGARRGRHASCSAALCRESIHAAHPIEFTMTRSSRMPARAIARASLALLMTVTVAGCESKPQATHPASDVAPPNEGRTSPDASTVAPVTTSTGATVTTPATGGDEPPLGLPPPETPPAERDRPRLPPPEKTIPEKIAPAKHPR